MLCAHMYILTDKSVMVMQHGCEGMGGECRLCGGRVEVWQRRLTRLPLWVPHAATSMFDDGAMRCINDYDIILCVFNRL